MKLFQIEEPEGGPTDPDLPGAAIGIDASGRAAVVAMAVGGNAVILVDREGFERSLPVPALAAGVPAWQELFEGARLRAERALSQPVTHAVVALAVMPDDAAAATVRQGAAAAGIELLRLHAAAAGETEPSLAAAVLAEDLVPRADPPTGR